MTSFRTLTLWSASALAVIFIAPSLAVAQDPDRENLKPVDRLRAAQVDKEKREQSREQRNAGKERKKPERFLWWNEPAMVTDLGLSDELRARFDGYLEASNESQLDRGAMNKIRKSYHEALRTGDWKMAESQLADWQRLAAIPIRAQGELKLNVLRALSAEQLEKLRSGYASIFVSRWVPRARWAPPRKADSEAK